MIVKFVFVTLVLCGSLFAGTINIAVAANVSYAINEITKEFNKLYPHTKIRVTLGGSGKLTAQIKNSAPYDLFMSANMRYPNALFDTGWATSKPIIYAKGSLAILSGKKEDFSKGLNILKLPHIKKIAIANPLTAPYGYATVEALKNAKLYEAIKSKLIYGESISQTVSYTVTATDLGFIAKSALFSPKMSEFKEGVNWVDVNSSLYNPIDQGIVILKKGKLNKEVKAFYEFILGSKSQKILESFGYTLP